MPKIRRQDLPPALLNHLLDRIKERRISADQLGTFADWLDGEPDVPEGKWFKQFTGMIVCGDGQLVKTFLTTGQPARGQKLSEQSYAGGFDLVAAGFRLRVRF